MASPRPFPLHHSGDNLSPLLDVFVFAARSRGDSPPALGRLLTEAVLSSTAAEFGRLSHSRVDMDGSGAWRDGVGVWDMNGSRVTGDVGNTRVLSTRT